MLELDKLFLTQQSGRVVSLHSGVEDAFRPFAFVPNVTGLSGASTIEIAPGHKLRRANAREIKFVNKTISDVFGKHFGKGLWEERKPKSGHGAFVRLPANQWRYFVIELPAGAGKLDLLDQALGIAPKNLEIGLAKFRTRLEGAVLPTCVYRPSSLFQSLSALHDAVHSKSGFLNVISKSDGNQISDVYKGLQAHAHSVQDLQRPLELLRELRDLPHFSPLQILGYFAILESLLTHQPNPDDRYDSITRQITNKLALLNARWQTKLDYSAFGGAPHKKIWSEMYAYRSAIAHGGSSNSASQSSVLKTAENANVLIRESVKQTLRQALIEPQLLADLHNC